MDRPEKKRTNAFARLYEEADLPKAIRRSLNFIILGNMCGSLFGVICGTGTASMVGLASSMGATDLTFGIMTGIGQAAALLQIPFSLLVNRTHRRKRYMLTYGVISRVLWMVFGLIPFFIPATPAQLRVWTLVFLLGISCCLGSVIQVCWFPWFSDLCPERIRSRWLAVREQIIAVVSILFGLMVAFLLDHLPPETRYIIIFLIGGAVGVMDMVSFGLSEEVYSAPPARLRIGSVIKDFAHNKPFLRLTVAWTLWCFTTNLSCVYYTPYSMNVMGLNFTQVMLCGNVAAAVSTILFVPRWGSAIYHHGARNVMLLTNLFGSVLPLVFLFSRPGSIWPLLIFNVFGAMYWTGSNLAATGLQLTCSPAETRPSYIALFSCITALAGAMLGSLVSGFFLDACADHGWFAGSFDRYKVLFTISSALRLGLTILTVPGLADENKGTVKTLIRAIFLGRGR